ncbi:MAG TPA: response regulator [Bacteroidales bacterium]|nr:response regulator [Bacteroidales bacterium]
MEKYCWDSRKILIAEDEETNYLFVEAILEDTKAQLIWARDGKDVLELINQHDVDLILMDIKMPEMDGITATRKIRQTNKDIPIIAQTAYAMSEDKTKCLNAGCNDYLAKPISHNLLLSTIEKYLTNK